MTNPNNAIGTNGAFDGRTSPNALNDITAAFTKGIVSGWNCAPKNGMTIQLGGSASVRDVALAENNAGDKLTVDNRSGAPVEVTLAGAPATNNRVDAIVAYVDNPSTGDGTTTDNPSPCGIIAVSGTVAANPTAPTDAQIRSAITTDGATGGVAYYVILATVLVGTNVTTIGSGVITQGAVSQSLAAIADGSITTDMIADDAVTSDKVDWATLPGAQSFTRVTGTMSGTTMANIGNAFTAPADGLYFATAHFNQNGNPGSTSFILHTMIQMAGAGDDVSSPSCSNYAGNHNCTITQARMAWLTAGQTIQMRGRTENWGGGVYGAMEVARIY